MITIEAKLERFKEIVFQELERKISESLMMQHIEADEQLREKRELVHKKTVDQIEKMDKSVDVKVRQMQIKVREMQIYDVLQLQDKMMKDLVDQLCDKAHSFVGTTDYYLFIASLMDKALTADLLESPIQVTCLTKDWPFVNEKLTQIGARASCDCNDLPYYQIGGVVISILDRHLRLDMTLKAAIDNYGEQISMRLYQLLEEAGGDLR